MKVAKQVAVGEKALAASSTVSVLEVSSALLWAELQSPTTTPAVFLEATVMVTGSDTYAAMFRLIAIANGPAPFTGLSVKRTLLWETAWDEVPFGYVNTLTMDMSSDLIRVRLGGTGDVTASTKATCWLKAWANG